MEAGKLSEVLRLIGITLSVDREVYNEISLTVYVWFYYVSFTYGLKEKDK